MAEELERSAGRAQARGGLAAAAAFLERAAALTADPARHADRILAAAQASMQAGAFGKAQALLTTAEAGPLDEFASARVDLLRGQIAFAVGQGSDAPPLLLKAAKRLEPLNRDLARDTYLSAWMAAVFAGHLAGAGDVLEVSCGARALPPPKQPAGPLDLLLDGLARLAIDGPGAAAPAPRQAASAFASADAPAQELLQFGLMAYGAAHALWDEDCFRTIMVRQIRLARDLGVLDQMLMPLQGLAHVDTWRGDFEAGRFPDRGSQCGLRGDREPHRALRGHAPRRDARQPGGARPADRASAPAASCTPRWPAGDSRTRRPRADELARIREAAVVERVGSPAGRSPPRCTSARGPSSGTSARSSPSSGSAPGGSCGPATSARRSSLPRRRQLLCRTAAGNPPRSPATATTRTGPAGTPPTW